MTLSLLLFKQGIVILIARLGMEMKLMSVEQCPNGSNLLVENVRTYFPSIDEVDGRFFSLRNFVIRITDMRKPKLPSMLLFRNGVTDTLICI
jgi:hypothetical protein